MFRGSVGVRVGGGQEPAEADAGEGLQKEDQREGLPRPRLVRVAAVAFERRLVWKEEQEGHLRYPEQPLQLPRSSIFYDSEGEQPCIGDRVLPDVQEDNAGLESGAGETLQQVR